MKVTYQHGPCKFEQECKNRKEAFEFISAVGDAFPAEPCGCCGKTNTAPSVRKAGGYTFFQMKCSDCTATLNIIFLDDGRCFPGRQDKEKNRLPNNGWSIYKGKDGKAQTESGSTEPGEKKEVIPF